MLAANCAWVRPERATSSRTSAATAARSAASASRRASAIRSVMTSETPNGCAMATACSTYRATFPHGWSPMAPVVGRRVRLPAPGRRDHEGSGLMALAFRNIDASPDDPVQTWPFEGVLGALERGGLPEWRRLAQAIGDQPWGKVARYVEQAVAMAHPFGVSEVMTDLIAEARREAAATAA